MHEPFDWLIAIPAWGERCVNLFLNVTLPSIFASEPVSGNIRFIVHTDEPISVEKALYSFNKQIFPVPHGNDFHQSAGAANRQALELANDGECVALINADMAASHEVFTAAERRFSEGRRMIMMAASRTLGGTPPVGAGSAELLRWTMEHRHPAISECFWVHGRSGTPWAIYFERDEEIVLHGFHLHPFAVVKDRPLNFLGVTIDFDLADNYHHDEIHIVTDADEAAFAEVSPPERVFSLQNRPIDIESVAYWAKRRTRPLHRWMFAQPIAIRGSGADIGDRAICADILDAIG